VHLGDPRNSNAAIPVPSPLVRKVLPFLYRHSVKQLGIPFFNGADGRPRVQAVGKDPSPHDFPTEKPRF
jgi:hypothetical protein